MELKTYTLEELEPYLYTLYSKPESLVPVSPLRLRSYMENPRARPGDKVLFEMREGTEVLAYRTLLPDCFFDREGNMQRFAWLSGNWVRPESRRQGFSTSLLELAEKHWDGRLMYSNYAPESKAVYDQTGRFKMIARREGNRFHLRSGSEDLLGRRLGFTSLLKTADSFVNRSRERKIQKFQFQNNLTCDSTQLNGFVAQLSELVSRLQQDALFRRDREIFQWALEYPWVSEQTCDPVNYYFSYKADRFENLIYQITDINADKKGIIWLLLHNNALSAPYLFAADKSQHDCMARTLIRTMIDLGCTYTTIRNPELVKSLMVYEKLFLAVRPLPQLIFAHESLSGLIPENPVIHDGDGDVMFTG